MVTYESFFLLILISILGPVVGLLILIFFNAFERQVYLMEVENTQVLLEKELETSKYIRLNQQIQPHFLFNALNSMLGLIRLKRFEQLSEIFEHMVLYLRSKYNEEQSLYTLKEEIEYTRHFVAIQQLRFGERLQVKWSIERGLENTLIVPYLLQTLVENAFKHGLENIEGEGTVQISIKTVDEKSLLLNVKDNGPGFSMNPLSHKSRPGIGLKNVSKRLKLLFGDKAWIDILPNDQAARGGDVSVIWPKTVDTEELGVKSK
ncbi:sensor histidine kinase [Bacillus freudenreichii]|nr:sensor histidine kinase [Bacillus freudenreichii]